ncbi:MAG: ATP-binding protein [Patescibacteria group bacterium]
MTIRYPLSPEDLEAYIAAVGPLRDAFDLVDDHIIVTDANGNILYANEAAERKTGFSAVEMMGKNPGDLWGGAMPDSFYADMWKRIKEEKQPFVGEVENTRKDGSRYWQELHISPVLDEAGTVKFFIGIEPEITDRRRREQFREEFVSIVGHQALTPATAVQWFLDWLLRRGGLTDEQRGALEQAYKNTAGLIQLLRDLLFLARFGKGHPNRASVDMASAIAQVVAAVKARHPGVALTFEDKVGAPVALYINPTLLEQLLGNIIGNAAEYSDVKTGAVAVLLERIGGRYRVSCRDNGIGIPPEDQPRIFTQFFRASNAAAAKMSGTGLGLFIAKMIAENLGWELSFESIRGSGTTFFIGIPVDWKMKS